MSFYSWKVLIYFFFRKIHHINDELSELLFFYKTSHNFHRNYWIPPSQSVIFRSIEASLNETRLQCCLCKLADKRVLLRPCNHLCLCERCNEAFQKQIPLLCPICHIPVKSFETIHLSWKLIVSKKMHILYLHSHFSFPRLILLPQFLVICQWHLHPMRVLLICIFH